VGAAKAKDEVRHGPRTKAKDDERPPPGRAQAAFALSLLQPVAAPSSFSLGALSTIGGVYESAKAPLDGMERWLFGASSGDEKGEGNSTSSMESKPGEQPSNDAFDLNQLPEEYRDLNKLRRILPVVQYYRGTTNREDHPEVVDMLTHLRNRVSINVDDISRLSRILPNDLSVKPLNFKPAIKWPAETDGNLFDFENNRWKLIDVKRAAVALFVLGAFKDGGSMEEASRIIGRNTRSLGIWYGNALRDFKSAGLDLDEGKKQAANHPWTKEGLNLDEMIRRAFDLRVAHFSESNGERQGFAEQLGVPTQVLERLLKAAEERKAAGSSQP
jgi:hypothetical protein